MNQMRSLLGMRCMLLEYSLGLIAEHLLEQPRLWPSVYRIAGTCIQNNNNKKKHVTTTLIWWTLSNCKNERVSVIFVWLFEHDWMYKIPFLPVFLFLFLFFFQFAVCDRYKFLLLAPTPKRPKVRIYSIIEISWMQQSWIRYKTTYCNTFN